MPHIATEDPDWTTPTEGRKCGTCTACCTYLGIEELKKYTGQACKHLAKVPKDPTKRCRIYDSRPVACSGYTCAWRQGAGPDHLRPNKCGFIITLYQSEMEHASLAGTIMVFDTAKVMAQDLVDHAAHQLLMIGVGDLRVINWHSKRGIWYYNGEVWHITLQHTPGEYESLQFATEAEPFGRYLPATVKDGEDLDAALKRTMLSRLRSDNNATQAID